MDGDGIIDVFTERGWRRGFIDSNSRYVRRSIALAVDGGGLAAGDIDGDGDIDLVAEVAENEMAWFENDGAGSFDQRETFGVGRIPQLIDINGDGSLDIISSDRQYSENPQWRVYSNDGDMQNLSEIASSSGIVESATDLDGDGKLDMLVIDDGLKWYKNSESETPYSDEPNLLEVSHSFLSTNRVLAMDIDADGDVDVLSGSSMGVTWNQNLGNAEFEKNALLGDFGEYAYVLDASDLDVDGKQDLILNFDFGDDNTWVWLKGGGDWIQKGANWQQIIGSGYANNSRLYFFDIDGDFDDDLVLRHETNAGIVGEYFAWLNDTVRVPGDSNADGRFDSTDLVTVFQRGEYEDDIVGNSTFADGDWNQDGDFNSRDFVFVFQTGTYIRRATAIESVAAAIDQLFSDQADSRLIFR